MTVPRTPPQGTTETGIEGVAVDPPGSSRPRAGRLDGLQHLFFGTEDIDASVGFGDVTIEGPGAPLVENVNAGDPAIRVEAPTVEWGGLGRESGLDRGGRSIKIVVLLAHWCPHCQADMPVIQEWVESGGLPDDVDLYGVTVLSDPLRSEFPLGVRSIRGLDLANGDGQRRARRRWPMA